jgi:CBS domain-containing protein
MFLFMGAKSEARLQSLLSLAGGHKVRDAMLTRFETLAVDDTLETAAERVVRTEQWAFPVLAADAKLVGLLTPAALVTAMGTSDRESAHVRDVMQRAPEFIEPNADLGTVVGRLAAGDRRRALAVVESDAVVGLVTWGNLMEFLALARAAGQVE